MVVSELRIGNLIQLNPNIDWCPSTDDLTVKVESVHKDGINGLSYCGGGMFWESPDKYVGIPLTEEWMLKSGFDKFEGYDFDPKHLKLVPVYIKDGHHIMLSGGKYWYAVLEYDGGTSESYQPVIEIDFVHQLQNLFHSLNREEILIKT